MPTEGDHSAPEAELESGLTSDNGLSVNGLSNNGLSANGLSANGLSANGLSGNGLSNNGLSANGLSANGLSANGFAAWFDSGSNNAQSHAYAAQLMSYIVRCACAKGVTRAFTDPATGTTYSWKGGLGLAQAWCSGSAATIGEQEWVSACLLAHVNALADPLRPDPNLSVQISVLATNSEVSLPASAEETRAVENQEGAYYGNIFDQQLGGQKGAYAAHVGSHTDSMYRFYQTWNLHNLVTAGRRCWIDGCPDVGGQTLKFTGDTALYMVPDDTFTALPTPQAHRACSSDTDCTGLPATPVCRLSTETEGEYAGFSYCAPRANKCSGGAFEPTSCQDDESRTWPRVLYVHLPAGSEVENWTNHSAGTSHCWPEGASAKMAVCGLSNGGWVQIDQYYHDWFVSSYHKVRVRYQGNGSLNLKVQPGESSAFINYGTKSLSCPAGSWCWTEWSGIKFSGLDGNAHNMIQFSGVPFKAAPVLDSWTIGATR